MTFRLPAVATMSITLGVWFAVLQFAWDRDSAVWYDRAELVGGAAGLLGVIPFLEISRALAAHGIVDHVFLWALRWALIVVVTSLMMALFIRLMTENTNHPIVETYWPLPTGLEERRNGGFVPDRLKPDDPRSRDGMGERADTTGDQS
jgi:hypothetical protein